MVFPKLKKNSFVCRGPYAVVTALAASCHFHLKCNHLEAISQILDRNFCWNMLILYPSHLAKLDGAIVTPKNINKLFRLVSIAVVVAATALGTIPLMGAGFDDAQPGNNPSDKTDTAHG